MYGTNHVIHYGCLPDNLWTTGTIYFLHSVTGNDKFSGTNKNEPKATLESAIANCVAGQADTIYVLPGHAETISTLFSLSVNDVRIIGLGSGDARGTFTLTGSASTFSLDGAGMRVSNLIFQLGADETVLDGITIGAAGATLDHCRVMPHATGQFTDIIQIDAVEAPVVAYNDIFGLANTSGQAAINSAASTQAMIIGNHIYGNYSSALIRSVAALVDGIIAHNMLRNVHVSGLTMDVHNSSTGIIAYNGMATADDFATAFDPGNMRCIENYLCDLVDTHGILIPSAVAT